MLYAQPPAFGGQIEVLLVVGDKTLASKKVAFTVHDVNQLTIGVVAAQPAGIVSGIQLPAVQNNANPVVIPLDVDRPAGRGWRPGRRSIASSGRTSTPTSSRSSRSPRSAAGSRSAAA